jgi:RNA polymerase sigma factor (sigma-70 family)
MTTYSSDSSENRQDDPRSEGIGSQQTARKTNAALGGIVRQQKKQGRSGNRDEAQAQALEIAETKLVDAGVPANTIADALEALRSTLSMPRTTQRGPHCTENEARCMKPGATQGESSAAAGKEDFHEVTLNEEVTGQQNNNGEGVVLRPVSASKIFGRRGGARTVLDQRTFAGAAVVLKTNGVPLAEAAKLLHCASAATLEQYLEKWERQLDASDIWAGETLLRQIIHRSDADEITTIPAGEVETRSLATDSDQPSAQDERKELEVRARALLESTIEFIPHPSFTPGYVPPPMVIERTKSKKAPPGLPDWIARLCEENLIKKKSMSYLFARMNALKCEAYRCRMMLDPTSPEKDLMDGIDGMLEEAKGICNTITLANLRLVVSIAKKHASERYSLEELFSEGQMALMAAIEKFDFGRGFVLSTYATCAIDRRIRAYIGDIIEEDVHFVHGESEEGVQTVDLVPDDETEGSLSEKEYEQMKATMFRLIDKLDRREQLIIRCRFALGPHKRVRTFKEIGDRLGISKERVRQIETEAIEKLQRLQERRVDIKTTCTAKFSMRHLKVQPTGTREAKMDAAWILTAVGKRQRRAVFQCLGLSIEDQKRGNGDGETLRETLSETQSPKKKRIAAARLEAAADVVAQVTTLTVEQVRAMFVENDTGDDGLPDDE